MLKSTLSKTKAITLDANVFKRNSLFLFGWAVKSLIDRELGAKQDLDGALECSKHNCVSEEDRYQIRTLQQRLATCNSQLDLLVKMSSSRRDRRSEKLPFSVAMYDRGGLIYLKEEFDAFTERVVETLTETIIKRTLDDVWLESGDIKKQCSDALLKDKQLGECFKAACSRVMVAGSPPFKDSIIQDVKNSIISKVLNRTVKSWMLYEVDRITGSDRNVHLRPGMKARSSTRRKLLVRRRDLTLGWRKIQAIQEAEMQPKHTDRKGTSLLLLVNQTMIGSGKFLSIYDEKLYLFLELFRFFGFY